jgi:hypothetical protein
VLRRDARVRRPLLLTTRSMTSRSTARQPVTTPSVWRAADVAESRQWTTTLDGEERSAIVATAERAAAEGHTAETLTLDEFEIAALARRSLEWSDRLNHGQGFILIRGFPVDELSPTAVELAYVGLGLHLGTPVSQDAYGTLLGHVRDERVERTSPAVRLYRTNQRQDFHTDGADLVGLLCLQRAKAGGESRIVSSYAVYNEMLTRRPDLVDVLYQPYYWDRNDEQGPGEPPFYALPPFTDLDGTPRIFYIGWYISDAQRHDDTPRLTDAQREAMDLLEAIANDPTFYIEMDFQPGDIQLLNNSCILHSREAYTDGDEPSSRRHLLRLWLAARHFTSVEDQLRQGIPQRR